MHRGDDAGKIFVGGLSYETTTEGLEMYFSKYGEVADCVIMKAKDPSNPGIERSRGFGFVSYRDPSCVQKVIDNRPHFLDNKEIDPKMAVPRAPGQPGITVQKIPSRSVKCFIGGIAQGTTEDDIKAFFSTFGPVSEVTLMKDPKTGRMRGFGFVGFHAEEAVQKICAIRFHQINGKTVEAKKAEPRDSRTPSVISGNMGGGMPRDMQQVQQPYMTAGYGMNSYGQPDGRGMYGGYAAQPVGGQPSPYGASVSAAQSPYSNYAQGSVSGMASSYPDRAAAGLGPDPGAQAAAGYPGYGSSMGMYGAIGAPTSAGRYDFASPGQGPPTSTNPAMPGRPDGAEFAAYGSYGLGSYPQEASQYGPTRGGLADSGFAAAAGGAPPGGAPQSMYGAEQSYSVGVYGESMGRGGSNATRGYHPYGR